MAVYVFESPSGKRIERVFPMGKAPRKIGRYERIVSFPSRITFAGGLDAGWNRESLGGNPERVTWDTVFKHINHTKQAAKEQEEKKFKHLKTFIGDHL